MTPNFQGEDLITRTGETPERLSPRDFRLSLDSPEDGTSENGHDPGIDADLVGPGVGYDRWMGMPEKYVEWRQITARALRPR